jgi:hypothetical protein
VLAALSHATAAPHAPSSDEDACLVCQSIQDTLPPGAPPEPPPPRVAEVTAAFAETSARAAVAAPLPLSRSPPG